MTQVLRLATEYLLHPHMVSRGDAKPVDGLFSVSRPPPTLRLSHRLRRTSDVIPLKKLKRGTNPTGHACRKRLPSSRRRFTPE